MKKSETLEQIDIRITEAREQAKSASYRYLCHENPEDKMTAKWHIAEQKAYEMAYEFMKGINSLD